MDLQKAKIYLDKLNREFARMSKDPENVVRLDVDIMAAYVRELYDAILSDEHPKAESHHAKKSTVHRHVEPPAEVAPPPVAATPKVVTAAPPPPPVVQEVAPAPAPPPPPPPPPAPPAPVQELAPPPPPAPVQEIVPTHAPTPPAKEPAATPNGVEILFEEKQVKELSDKLSELPIADLKKAIALNDRLLLTSELFAGDGKAFESAISAINHLNSFDAAQDYLVEHCVVRYAWTDKKRIDTAKTFIRLVRRRFK